MRGHIVKRGKNSYSLKVSIGKETTTSKYKYQWVSVKGTKKDAEKITAQQSERLKSIPDDEKEDGK